MRRTLAVVLLALAVPLIAFPIVAPPADPPDQLVHSVYDTGATPDQYGQDEELIAYEDLSPRAQTLFDGASAAGRNGSYVVDVGAGAPELNYTGGEHLTVVHDGTVHFFQGYERRTLPEGQSVLFRLGALAIGVLAAALGGYWRLNAEQ